MDEKQLEEFMQIAFMRMANSVWTAKDAAKELSRYIKIEKEKEAWKKQAQESESAFSGVFWV